MAGTASAVQVMASNNAQQQNNSENGGAYVSYTRLKIITTPNITGTVNTSFELYGTNNPFCAYGKILKNGTELIGAIQSDCDGSYSFYNQTVAITLNSSDTLELWAKQESGGYNVYVRNFRLMYDNMTAPSITFPQNNSIINQTVNITWNQIGSSNISYQYEVSRDNFSTIYSSWNTSNLYSRNISFIYYGQYYLRTRTHDTSLDVWSDWGNTTYFSRVNINIIGINGINFSIDSTSNHTTINQGSQTIGIGLFADNFDDGTTANWTSITSGTGSKSINASTGNLIITNGGATSNDSIIYNDINYTNITLFALVKETTDYGNYDGFGLIMNYWFPSWSTRSGTEHYYYFHPASPDNRLGTVWSGTNTWQNITASGLSKGLNYWYMQEAYTHKLNSTHSSMGFSTWNGTNSVNRPISWDTSFTSNFTTGRIGFHAANNIEEISWMSLYENYENGSIRSDGWYFNSMVDLGSNNISALLWNGSIYTSGAGGVTGVDLYINSSDNNITWTGNVLIQTNATLETYYSIPESSKKRYVKLGFYAYENTLLSFPTINNLKYTTTVNNYVSGYVKNATSGIPSAKVILYGNITLTDLNGFYNISDIPSVNFSIVAGKTGYDAKDNYIINNGTSQTNINFTLPVHVQVPENEIIKAADRGFVSWMPNIEQSGRFNWQSEGVSGIKYADASLFRGGAMIYAYGYNRTPEFLESTIRLGNYMTPFVISPPWDGVTWDAANDLWNIEHNDTDGMPDFQIEFYAIGLRALKPNISTNQWNYWNVSLGAFNVTTLRTSRLNWDKNCTGFANNVALFSNHARLVRMELGHPDNLTQINYTFCRLSNNTNSDGFGVDMESPSSTLYQNVLSVMGYNIIKDGYYKNNSFNNTVNSWSNWSRKWQLKDGNYIIAGRGSGQSSDKYGQAGLGLLSLVGNRGSNYRFSDLAFAKFLQMEIPGQSGRFYPVQNYFPIEDRVGIVHYVNYVDQSTMVAQSLAEMNTVYDPTVIESAIEYQNSYDNQTGFVLLNGINTNYSIYAFRLYQAPSNWGYDTYRIDNSTGIYPLNFRFGYKDAKYPSFVYNPEDTDNSIFDATRNFLGFNNRSILVNTNYIDFFNLSHSILKMENNSMSINFTGFQINQSGTVKSLDFYNMSAEINDTSDTVHIKYLIGWNSSNVSLTSTDIGIDLMQNNGQTQANISAFGNGLNYSFDTETMNITNITVTNGILQNVNLTCGFTGYNAWGKHNRTCFDSTITGNPWSIEYDVKMSTTNVYELAFNNPPGILDFSPATPYNTTLGENASFWVQFTQPIDYVNWTINGSSVQNHSCPGECQDQYIDTYINSTDLPRATRVVNATGNNSQGNATMSWTWTSGNHPITITGVSVSTYVIGTGQSLYIDAGYTDNDTETPTFLTNFTNGTFNNVTGEISWNPTAVDFGIHNFSFGVTDNYGSYSWQNITVDVRYSIPPIPMSLGHTITSGWINYTWIEGNIYCNNATTDTYLNSSSTIALGICTNAVNLQGKNWAGALTNSTTVTTWQPLMRLNLSSNGTGNIRLNYSIKESSTISGRDGRSRWYINGQPIGNFTNTTGTSSTQLYNSSQTFNRTWAATDLIYVYANRTTAGANTITVQNVTANFIKQTAGTIYNTTGYNVSVNGAWSNVSNISNPTKNISTNATVTYGNIYVWAYNNQSGNLSSAPVYDNNSKNNSIPGFTQVEDVNWTNYSQYSVQLVATDDDGDILTFGNMNGFGNLNSTGYFTWTPDSSFIGETYLQFNVTDGIEIVPMSFSFFLIGTFIPPTPINCITTNGTTWINVSCTAGSGNITDEIRGKILTFWYNQSQMYFNVTGLPEDSEFIIRAYPWNSSGDGTLGNYTQMVGRTLTTFFPPSIPIITGMTTGNFWKNLTWTSSGSNITDGFNASRNGSWQNNTLTYRNTTAAPHGWINDSIHAYNASGIGSLSSVITNDTQMPNNVPVQAAIGNKEVTAGNWLNFTINTTDADGDTITYASNNTKGTLSGYNYSWLPTGSDVGSYYWNFNSSDAYGGLAQENITVTVNSNLFIPPTPINLTSTQGNFWINYTWESGIGNITNSYNVSINGTWVNGTTNLFDNGTTSPHGWRNISIYSYNNSGTGTLNTTPISLSTQLLNNAPIQDSIGNKNTNEGQLLVFQINSSDADNDTLSYASNNTKGNLNLTGYFSWTPTYSDAGVYNWSFNTTDNYSAVATETITITVTNINQPVIPPIPSIISETNGSFWVNHTWSAGSGNITDSYNVSVNNTWSNTTIVTYKNTTTTPHGWINITVQSYNSSEGGSLNTTPSSKNTQVQNNIPVMNIIGAKNINESQWVNFTISGTDTDNDSLSCSTNKTPSSLTGCDFNWSTNYSDSGIYNWIFYLNDSYNGFDSEIVTVTVNDTILTYIPPIPTINTVTQNNFWINHTWESGSGNITDSYNSTNQTGIWQNNTQTYRNTTVAPHGWSNISVYAYNNTGILNTTPLANNTQLINNIPVQNNIGNKNINEGDLLWINLSSSDLDNDNLTYATNRTDLFTQSGYNFSWQTNYTSAGIYYIIFNTTDNYSAIDTETITTTVSDIPLTYIPDTPVVINSTQDNFWVNHTFDKIETINRTDSFNVTNGTFWQNNTNQSFNISVAPHNWSNISVYAYNSSGTGTLNTTPATQNIQKTNNPITISDINPTYNINEGQTLSIDVNYADLDSDIGTFDDNASQWNINSTTGVVSWVTGYSDAGNYSWQINVSDSYGSIDFINFTVTISDITLTYMPPTPINCGSTNSTTWINVSCTAGDGNVTDEFRYFNGTQWYNGTLGAWNNTGLPENTQKTYYIYAYNATGILNTSYATVINTTQTIPLSITSSTPSSPVTTTLNSPQTFTIETNKNANYTWLINDSQVQINNSVSAASYTNSTAPIGLYNVTVNIDSLSVTWNWTVTALPTYSISGYVFDNNNAPLQSVLVSNGSNQSTTTSLGYYSITGMLNGSYNLTFNKTTFSNGSLDITINGSSLTNQNKTIYDNSTPAQVTNLINGTISTTTINLSWDSLSDASHYRIYRNDTQVGTSTNAYYNDTGLTQNTLYNYIVNANDTYNNTGLNSTTLQVTTSATQLTYNLSGYVISDGTPIISVLVSYSGGNNITNSNGYYQINNINNGTYSFTAYKSGYDTNITSVLISGNTTQNFTVTLTPAATPTSGNTGGGGSYLPPPSTSCIDYTTPIFLNNQNYRILLSSPKDQPVQALNIYFDEKYQGQYNVVISKCSAYTRPIKNAITYLTISPDLNIKNTSSMDIKSNISIEVYQQNDKNWTKLQIPYKISDNIYRVKIDSLGTFAVTTLTPVNTTQPVEIEIPKTPEFQILASIAILYITIRQFKRYERK